MIRNIVFDFGGVLLDLDVKRTFDRLSELMDISFNDGLPQHLNDVLLEYEMGKMSTEHFLGKIQYFSKNKNLHAQEIIDAWNAMLLGWTGDKFTFLKALRDKYKVYLLSNTNELHIDWVMKDLLKTHYIDDFENTYFDACFYSHKVGDRKPNATIFNFVMEITGLIPDQTLFIDDTLENVVVARLNCWHAVHHPSNKEIATSINEYFINAQ